VVSFALVNTLVNMDLIEQYICTVFNETLLMQVNKISNLKLLHMAYRIHLYTFQ